MQLNITWFHTHVKSRRWRTRCSLLSSTSFLSSRIGFSTWSSPFCLQSKIAKSIKFPPFSHWCWFDKQGNFLQDWSLQMGWRCPCHHHPSWLCNHDGFGQSVPSSDFNNLSFDLCRRLMAKDQASARASGALSLFLPIQPSFWKRKKTCQ